MTTKATLANFVLEQRAAGVSIDDVLLDVRSAYPEAIAGAEARSSAGLTSDAFNEVCTAYFLNARPGDEAPIEERPMHFSGPTNPREETN